jgi:hypothetical protein
VSISQYTDIGVNTPISAFGKNPDVAAGSCTLADLDVAVGAFGRGARAGRLQYPEQIQ